MEMKKKIVNNKNNARSIDLSRGRGFEEKCRRFIEETLKKFSLMNDNIEQMKIISSDTMEWSCEVNQKTDKNSQKSKTFLNTVERRVDDLSCRDTSSHLR